MYINVVSSASAPPNILGLHYFVWGISTNFLFQFQTSSQKNS